MVICVDFNDLDLVEEVDFLPYVYKDFSIDDQLLMFDLIRKLETAKNLKLMDRFKLVYENIFNESFVLPIPNDLPVYNIQESIEEENDDDYTYPLSSRIINLSLERGSTDICEKVEAPKMIIDRVHYNKKGNVPILWDEDDEGAPLPSRRARPIAMQIEKDGCLETASNDNASRDNYPSAALSDISNIPPTSNEVSNIPPSDDLPITKSPIRIRNKKRQNPYNLRSRSKQLKSSHLSDFVDDEIATCNLVKEQPMDFDQIETIKTIKVNFIKEETFHVKVFKDDIILCKGRDYLRISRIRSDVSFYSDNTVWIQRLCQERITALSLLRGYILNRDEVNGVWNEYVPPSPSSNEDVALVSCTDNDSTAAVLYRRPTDVP